MKINLILMFVSIALLFRLPIHLSLLLDLGLYSSLVWFQYCFEKPSLVNLILVFVYGLLATLYYGFGYVDVVPITGIAVYLAFALYYSTRVFTQDRVQRWSGVLYLSIALSCIALSFLLKPDLSYIYVPLLMFSVGTIAKGRIESQISKACRFYYSNDEYSVSEVSSDRDQADFNSVLKSAYSEIYLKIKSYPNSKPLSESEFAELISETDSRSSRVSCSFVVRTDSGKSVGAFKLYYGDSLPIETDFNLNLDPVREHSGSVAEIGRLSLLESYRLNPNAMNTIFKSIALVVMKRRIGYVFCQAVQGALPLYRKMGFQSVPGSSGLDKEFGIPCSPLYVNLAPNIIGKINRKLKSVSGVKETREVLMFQKRFNKYVKAVRISDRIPGSVLERVL